MNPLTPRLHSFRADPSRSVTPYLGAIVWLVTSAAGIAAPAVVSSAGLPNDAPGAASIGVRFDRLLEATSAATAGNYTLNKGALIQNAQLLTDGQTVVLTVDQMATGPYTLTINGVKDTNNDPAVNLTVTVPVLDYTAGVIQGSAALNNVLHYATSSNAIFAQAAGGDSWVDDSIGYLSRQRTGDFDIRVQCVGVTNAGNVNARMSIEVRNTMDPTSAHLAVATFTGRTYWGAWLRETQGGAPSVLWFNYPSASGDWVVGYPPDGMNLPNNWLRVRRVGNTFTTFAGTNGLNWTRVGNHFIGTNFAATLTVGLATANGDTSQNMVAHYGALSDYAYTNAAIGITEPPANKTVTQLEPVTFSVGAVLTNGWGEDLIYEWRSNGVSVARGPWNSYSFAATPVSANGSAWTVTVSAPGVTPVTSTGAILTVLGDVNPPAVLSAAGLPNASGPATIGIAFDKLLDPASAAELSNFRLSNGAQVQGAQLMEDGQTVVLTIDQLTAAAYSLTIQGVRDAALNPPLTTTVTVPVLTDLTAQTIQGGYPITAGPDYATSTNTITVQVIAGDSWNPDSVEFVYRQIAGDFDVRVQCLAVTNGGNGNARFSLDARDSVDPSSRHVAVATFPGRTYWGSWYRPSGGASSVLWGTPGTGDWLVGYPPAGMDLPHNWLRLRRAGNVITTFASTNGVTWMQVGGNYADATLPEIMLVGLASASGSADLMVAQYGHFGNYAYADASVKIGITDQPQSKAVVQLQPVTFSVGAVLTNGAPTDLLYEWRSNGVTVAKGPAASYSLAATPLSANGSVWQVIVSAPGVSPLTSANAILSVLADVNPPAVVSAAGLRASNDVSTVAVRFNKLLDPVSAAAFGAYSLNGNAQIQGVLLLADGMTIVLTVDQLTNASYALTITGVQDAALNPPANLTVTVPVLGYVAETLRGPDYPIGTSLSYAISSNLIGVQVAGGDSWLPEAVNFVYQPVTNDFDIRVQCLSVVNGTPWDSRLSLDVRDSTDPASRHVAVGAFPARGYWGSWLRPETGGNPIVLWGGYPAASGDWTVAFPTGAMNAPNNWLRIRRVGNAINTYAGTNGLDWSQVGGTFTDPNLPAVMVIGLESASKDMNILMTAEYSNFGRVLPTVLSAARDFVQSTKVTVVFSAALDPATATNAGNYALNHGNVVTGATLNGDGTTVVLTTSPLAYTVANILTVNNVQDMAGQSIASDTQVGVVVPSDPIRQQFSQEGRELVVLEAEHFNLNTPAGGKSWVYTTLPPTLATTDANTNFSGVGAMYASPNTGVNAGSPALGTTPSGTPRLDFTVQFTKAGMFYVWVRGLGDSGGASVNDSVLIGLDGALTTRLTGFQGGQGYTWGNAAVGDSGPITVSTPGVHVINMWMREDGFVADRILLTSDSGFTPSGSGPPESSASPAPLPTQIILGRSGANLELSWAGIGILQAASNVAGPYQDVVGSSSPFVVTPNQALTFYRVRQ